MTQNYRLYDRRWLILAVFSLTSMMNEEIWISLSTITSIVQRYYQVNPIWVNWLSLTYFLSMVLLLVPSSYFLNRFGLRCNMIFAGMFNVVGSCLRLIGSGRNGFAYVFVGSAICSIGQCCLFFLPPHIAVVWFGDSERTTASSIGMLASCSGIAVGFLLSTIFVSNLREYESEIGHGIRNLLMFEVLASTLLFLLCVVFIKDAPPTPPSRSQELRLNGFTYNDDEEETNPNTEKEQLILEGSGYKYESETGESNVGANLSHKLYTTFENETACDKVGYNTPSFKDSLLALLKDKQFNLLCQAYAIYNASIITYTTVLNQITVLTFPGREKEVGYMGFAAMSSGLLSMFLSGIFLNRTKQFKLFSVIDFILAIISTLLLTIVLHVVKSVELAFALYIIYGICSYPFISAGLEYAAEITYPLPESISSSICIALSCFYGIILTQILGTLLNNGVNIGGYIMSGLYGLGFILVFAVKAPLKRSSIDFSSH